MRKNVVPSTGQKDVKNTEGKMKPVQFQNFSRGTIQDPPASEVEEGFADSLNITAFPGFYEGRLGNRLYTSTRFPSISGRTGYSAYKVDDTVISQSGDIFLPTDPGNYFCWGDVYELILEYIDPQHIRVESKDFFSTNICSIMGAPNVFFFHKSLKIWVLVLGNEIYFADEGIPSWNKVLIVSKDQLFNTISDYSEYLDKTIIFNGNGIFKADILQFPIAYRANIDPPNVRILSVPNFVGAASRYRYLYSAQRIANEGGIVNRQTPSIIDLETGTNAVDENNIDYGEVYTKHVISPQHPFPVRTLWVPEVPNSNPKEYQWHFSHFPVWRTLDLEALNVSDVTRTKYNDPSVFVWVDDVRMCAAFWISISGNKVTALRGTFEVADVHSVLELDDGQRFEIVKFISSVEVEIISEYYYGNLSIGLCAAAIGNGRVIRGSVTGDVLTATPGYAGSYFNSSDLRKTIWNSDGYRLYIIEIINPTQVRVHVNNDLPLQGFTMGPTHRNFYDTVTDDILFARLDFYSCYARYRKAIPNCNVGKVIPGFVIAAIRGQKDIYYQDLQAETDYLIGQYVPIQLNNDVQDAITLFWVFSNVLSVICATSTWGAQLGVSNFTTLPGSGESIALLTGLTTVDKSTGCLDPGSVQDIGRDTIELITNEPGGEALRQFSGMTYSSEDVLTDSGIGGRIIKALRKTKRLSAAIYDGIIGYVLWRKNA
jgi:hypothetical protein